MDGPTPKDGPSECLTHFVSSRALLGRRLGMKRNAIVAPHRDGNTKCDQFLSFRDERLGSGRRLSHAREWFRYGGSAAT